MYSSTKNFSLETMIKEIIYSKLWLKDINAPKDFPAFPFDSIYFNSIENWGQYLILPSIINYKNILSPDYHDPHGTVKFFSEFYKQDISLMEDKLQNSNTVFIEIEGLKLYSLKDYILKTTL